MKKSIKMLLLALGLSMALVACGNSNDSTEATEATTEATETKTEATEAKTDETEATEKAAEETEEAKENEMQFISTEDAKTAVDEHADEYVLLDLRKAEDYEADHVDGFVSADVDAAKNGDIENGVEQLKKATEGEDLENKKILLMCYSGAGYAQVGTDLLINEMGVNPENIYTVEGGMKAW